MVFLLYQPKQTETIWPLGEKSVRFLGAFINKVLYEWQSSECAGGHEARGWRTGLKFGRLSFSKEGEGRFLWYEGKNQNQ